MDRQKEEALLTWINSLELGDPVKQLLELQDGNLLLKLVTKLKGEEPSLAFVHLTQEERLSMISEFLNGVCHAEDCVSLPKGNQLELTKVLLLLCYYGFFNNRLVTTVDLDTELQIAAMLRYIQQEENGLSVCDGLSKLLASSSLIHSSSGCSVSPLSADDSPFYSKGRRSPLVSFVELNTVASSSFVGSPIQELISTPQVQLKRLRKDLAREEDIRDELERELAERLKLISERESQISQLQHRLQRLLRDQDELEKGHKASLSELELKNEGLLQRIRDIVKQCQDLRTDNTQNEKRLDELMEANGSLAAQVRNTTAQLARAEVEVVQLEKAHELSQREWWDKRDVLQAELGQALSNRASLSEQIEILQGKISVLEEELVKLSNQMEEKGEVLGPILEHDQLSQEITALTLKLTQLEGTISCLEREKLAVETLLSEERNSFETKTLHLDGQISELQQSISSVRAEREAQEQTARDKVEDLTNHISALETNLAYLQKLEVQLTSEIATSAELRQQREALEVKVALLEKAVNLLQSTCHDMQAENKMQQEVLDTVKAELQNAQVSLVEYERKLTNHHKVVEENSSLHARILALDATIVCLQTEIEAERKRGETVVMEKEQQQTIMEEKFHQQETKAREMLIELENLSQELRKMKHQKLDADSCIEKLTKEGLELKASLVEAHDQTQSQLELAKKAKDASELELQRIITDHQGKICELQSKVETTVESLKQSEAELLVLKEKISSQDSELEVKQHELTSLQNTTDNLQMQLLQGEINSQQMSQDVESKNRKVQQLTEELGLKEAEIQSLKDNIQFMETNSTEIRNLHQSEVKEQSQAIAKLELQLSEAERLLSERAKALEDLAEQLKYLKEQLSIEIQKSADLENRLGVSKVAHEVQEQTLKLEIVQLHKEVDGHLKKLDEVVAETKAIKVELSLQQDTVLQKEQDILVLGEKNKILEEEYTQLQNKLAEATMLATERQSMLLVLQEEVRQQESLLAEAQKIEETQRKDFQREVTELQSQIQELTNLASERQTLVGSLHEKMKEQEESNQKHLEKAEEAFQKELEKVIELQQQLDDAKCETMAKSELLAALKEKLKQMELLCKDKEKLAIKAAQAKETLEKTVTELCTNHKKELDMYLQDMETMKKDKEDLSLVNQSLQVDCQNLQAESKEQQETLTALRADLQSTQDGCKKDVDSFKKEQERLISLNQSLQSECQNLQVENTRQQEKLKALKTDLCNIKDEHQQELDTLISEKNELSSVIQSLQTECQNLQTESKGKQEELNSANTELQNFQIEYKQEVEILMKAKEDLSAVNQCLESECQNMEVESKKQQELINLLKADLQSTQNLFQCDVETLKNEKEQLSTFTQSIQTECQNLQAENTGQKEALSSLMADLQKTEEVYQQELGNLLNEKDCLSSVNQSLQTHCQNLQAENEVQQEALDALKADLQKTKEDFQEMLEREKEHFSSMNQSLQTRCQNSEAKNTEAQESLTALKDDLEKTKESYQQQLETLKIEKEHLCLISQNLQTEKMGLEEKLNALKAEYQKDLETLKEEKEHLSLVSQSLLEDSKAAQQLRTELMTVKGFAEMQQQQLESQVGALQIKINGVLAVVAERETEISNLQQEVRQQEASRLCMEESEKALRAKFESTVAQLQIQFAEASKMVSEKTSALNSLLGKFEECEKQKQDVCQTNEVLTKAIADLRITQMQELEELKSKIFHLTSVNNSLQNESRSFQEALKELGSDHNCLLNEVEALKNEKQSLFLLKLSLQRECEASQRLSTELEAKLTKESKSSHDLKEAGQQMEKENQDLQEQLKVKTEAVSHYKLQVEKARYHYNSKKQQLREELETRQALESTVQNREGEIKALKAELKLASMELEKMNSSEKNFFIRIKSLETQLDYADRQVREQRKQPGQHTLAKPSESYHLKVPGQLMHNTSADSLDLDDSLSVAGKPSAPGKSSTPLSRSSERLAAKRRAQSGASLETNFTPMMSRGRKRDATGQDQKLESGTEPFGELALDSAKEPSSPEQRRRTTQVINITMAKKPGGGGLLAADEFLTHSRPTSAEGVEEPDQLLSLPGYRRSFINSNAPTRSSSTFCIGAENEPDHLADDWVRIAELQSRNKACLPHLKSSYPLESRPSLGFSYRPLTEDDVRTGDPIETIRRASVHPSQLKDSVIAHQHFLGQHAGSSNGHASSQQDSNAYQIRSTRSPLAVKRPAGQMVDVETPEAKKQVSCFPRTPKGKSLRIAQNVRSTPAIVKQSTVFMIENTPKKPGRGDSRLQRGFNRLRNTSTKSPKIPSSAKKLISFKRKT